MKNSNEKLTFYSQPLSIERTAHSEGLQEAELGGLLQCRLCGQALEECLMWAMWQEGHGNGKGWAGCVCILCVPVLAHLWVWGTGRTLSLWSLRCLSGEERAAHSQVLPSSHHIFFQKGKPRVEGWRHDLWEHFRMWHILSVREHCKLFRYSYIARGPEAK